jgi:hypothetical protein
MKNIDELLQQFEIEQKEFGTRTALQNTIIYVLTDSMTEITDVNGYTLKYKEDKYMTCSVCNKTAEDVALRPDGYTEEIVGEIGAMWVACDYCDHENDMDI